MDLIAAVDLTNKLHLFVLVMALGIFGMTSHPFIKWAKHEVESPIGYLFRDSLRATFLSFTALVSAAAAAVAADAFVNMNIWQVAMVAIPWGWANDSALNTGAKKPAAPDATPPA